MTGPKTGKLSLPGNGKPLPLLDVEDLCAAVYLAATADEQQRHLQHRGEEFATMKKTSNRLTMRVWERIVTLRGPGFPAAHPGIFAVAPTVGLRNSIQRLVCFHRKAENLLGFAQYSNQQALIRNFRWC